MMPPTPVNLSHAERQRCQTELVIGGDSVQPSRASTNCRWCVCVHVRVSHSLESRGGAKRHSDSNCKWEEECGTERRPESHSSSHMCPHHPPSVFSANTNHPHYECFCTTFTHKAASPSVCHTSFSIMGKAVNQALIQSS